MTTRMCYPNAVLAKTPSTLIGDHGYVDEDPATPDGLWIAQVETAASGDIVNLQEFSSADTGASTSSTVTVTKPTGVEVGDTLLFFFSTPNDGVTQAVPTLTTGWNTDGAAVTNSTVARLMTKSRAATGSEPASYEFTFKDSGNASFATKAAVCCVRVSGLPSTWAEATASDANSTWTAPSVTTLGTNRLTLCVWAISDSQTAQNVFLPDSPRMFEIANRTSLVGTLDARLVVGVIGAATAGATSTRVPTSVGGTKTPAAMVTFALNGTVAPLTMIDIPRGDSQPSGTLTVSSSVPMPYTGGATGIADFKVRGGAPPYTFVFPSDFIYQSGTALVQALGTSDFGNRIYSSDWGCDVTNLALPTTYTAIWTMKFRDSLGTEFSYLDFEVNFEFVNSGA